MGSEPRRVSLKWKIGGAFTGAMFVLGLLTIAGVYAVASRALRAQLEQRMLSVTRNLSDAAAAHVLARDVLALYALARKYTLLEGVAYAVIEDGKGEILAHTLGSVPPELRPKVPGARLRQVERRELWFEDRPVTEIGVPVLEGQFGRARVGFWQDAIEKEIRRAVGPVVGIVASMPLAGALLAFLIAHWIVRPIAGLTEVADRVTRGDLEAAIGGDTVKARDEIGDLARSLERMRSSLRAAMLRLNREPV